MKAKFIVSPTIKSADGGIESVRTDMLVLTKIQGIALGPGPSAVDQALDGAISARVEQNSFKGELGENLVLSVSDQSHPQRHVLLVGLGPSSSFDHCALVEVIDVAVAKAVARKCNRLSIPVVANRMTQLNLNLRGTAHIVRTVAERRLAAIDGDGTLEIELICTSQAKRHLEAGLACRKKLTACCAK
ncbi:MAG TPA: M17 family peptidase N-terminal domain-containing protein [Chroococcales cyanobacterium]